MRFRNTTFRWATDQGEGPHEDYSPGESRVVAPIHVEPGTADARMQAASDILGWNALRTDTLGGNTVRYVSRATPMLYNPVKVPPGSPALAASLYATSLVRGTGMGVGTTNAAGGVDYPKYEFQLTMMQRAYSVREDADVLASQADPGETQSPLWAGGRGLPDEGDVLKRFGVKASRYVRRRFMPSGRFTTVPAGFLQFGNNDKLNESFPYNEVTASIIYEWKLVPLDAVPWTAIRSCLGAVDQEWFDAFGPETMLLTDVFVEYGPGALGDLLADCRYTFSYAPKFSTALKEALGHNAALRVRPNTGGVNTGQVDYDEIFSAGNPANKPFRTHNGTDRVDLASLFRPDQP